MRILLLSIIAKCGVFTHVRELALYMQKLGMEPVVGMIHNLDTVRMFKVTKTDMGDMRKSLNGINHFIYESDEALLKQIKSMKLDLVHAHSPLVLASAVKVSHKRNLPFVMTLHGVLDWRKFYGPIMEFADGIIAIGPEVAKSAGHEYQKKIQIIFNGIDTEHYQPGKNNTTNGPLRIIWIGRTSGPAASGAGYLAQALRILKKKGIRTESKVIGHALGADIGDMEACGWVHDPLPYLQWSHLVFARGRALREAMACGNVGFLISQGYGGMVQEKWFENKNQPILSGSLKHGYAKLDSSAIVKDILYFHHHRKHLEEARKIARKIATDYFDIRIMVEQTYLAYEKAIQFHSHRKKKK